MHEILFMLENPGKILEFVKLISLPPLVSKLLGAVLMFLGSVFIFGLVYVGNQKNFLFQLFFGPIFIYLGWELLKL
ncbi:MAG: hypothetical protein DRP00_01325 [Candidatus Aenigmatarchaeota archaeon]|nr:MAG: hypothetical protein DRP00_01325 [Candidatus Aenigmarchaeota archaeon]HDD71668.1 hypothetical protein [Candidatus Aenigmarchaeota archaeon]